VAGGLDEPEFRAGYTGGEFLGLGHGNPRVVDSPADQDRDINRAVPVLDLIGVLLIRLRDLAVEGRLAAVAEPRLDESVQDRRV
jgi:hypothetical protein